MQTPVPVMWFSRLWIGSLVVSVASMVVTWDDLVKDVPSDSTSKGMSYAIVVGVAASVGVSVLLWFYVMRRRSRTARTIMTVLSVIGAVFIAVALVGPFLGTEIEPDQRSLVWQIAENIAVAVSFFANALLFVPAARQWFTRDPEFSDVFS